MPRLLEGKSVIVGLTGGIACYKGAELVRHLTRAGAVVRVMMSAGAQQFITPLTMQTLSGHPVSTDTFDLTQESEIGHIQLADSADAIILAPATANVIAKVAAGVADDLMTTVLLATRAPVLIAPAMNVHMYENALVQANIERLRQHGYRIIEPAEGALACGYEGKGRLPDPDVLIAELERVLAPQDFRDERVLITAGPNREAIDPVRFISNRSTGKMGFALADAAWRRGASVTLVAGPTDLPTPYGAKRVDVSSAAEMHAAVATEFASATVLLMAAAVADYRPVRAAREKLKKSPGGMTLELERTVDILAQLAPQKGTRIVVGFAAETERVTANAERKLARKNLDLVIANDVSRADRGFASDTNAVVIIDRNGERESVPLMSKGAVAHRILDRVAALKRGRASAATPSRQRVRSA